MRDDAPKTRKTTRRLSLTPQAFADEAGRLARVLDEYAGRTISVRARHARALATKVRELEAELRDTVATKAEDVGAALQRLAGMRGAALKLLGREGVEPAPPKPPRPQGGSGA
ncbi:MAG: hypothetical protein HOW73_26710 [Polyangiaceae bacterium]|nr:hypothetical protein [Polyangiaceae bacterium]